MSAAHPAARLAATLARRYPVVAEHLTLGERRLTVHRVGNPSEIFDAIEVLDDDERIPYWVELWPAALGLAGFLAQHPWTVRGRRVVELGCGLGLGSLAAAVAGASLVVGMDLDEDATAFARLNALENGFEQIHNVVMDWRQLAFGARFPVVLAADVAYERRFFEPLTDALAALLAKGGEAYVAEPGREVGSAFLDELRTGPWAVERVFRFRPASGGARPEVSIYRIQVG